LYAHLRFFFSLFLLSIEFVFSDVLLVGVLFSSFLSSLELVMGAILVF